MKESLGATAPAVIGGLPAREPIEPDDVAEAEAGVEVSLGKVEAVDGKAGMPGEVEGPAVRFTLEVTNATGEEVDLSGALVSLYYGKTESPGLVLSEPGGKPFPRSVPAGESATGVFVFGVPKDARSAMTATLDYQAGEPAIAFDLGR